MRLRPAQLIAAAVALVAVIVAIIVITTSGGGDGGGGNNAGGDRGLRSEPKNVGEIDVDAVAAAAGLIGSTFVVTEYGDSKTTVAYDLDSGDELWSKRGHGAVLGSTVYVIDDGTIQGYSAAGKRVGESINADGDTLWAWGNYLEVDQSDNEASGFTLVHPGSGNKESDVQTLSSNMQYGLRYTWDEFDYELDVEVFRLPGGEPVGDNYQQSYDSYDSFNYISLLDNGQVVVAADGMLYLYDLQGEELDSVRAEYPYGTSSVADFVAVDLVDEAIVYRVAGNEFQEVDSVGSTNMSMRLSRTNAGPVLAGSGDGEVATYLVTNDKLVEVLSENGTIEDRTVDVVYLNDDGDLSGWDWGNGESELWSIRVPDEMYSYVFDRVLVIEEYNSDRGRTSYTIYR